MNADVATLRTIGWPLAHADTPSDWTQAMALHSGSRPARIIEQHRSGYIVAENATEGFSVASLPDWQRADLPAEQRPAVGDWILITEAPDHTVQAAALLARRGAIKRSAAGKHYGQQVIAANIDIVFIVSSLDRGFNARRIERYLLLVREPAQPVVVLTKTDLASAREINNAQAALAALGIQEIAICAVNAKNPDSVSELRRWLTPGTTAVLVGSSGVGKSTLTNTLLGYERMATGEVRADDARGRHTTTHRALIPLPSGACLIDTPGMRELKPTGEENLAEGGFADIEALAEHCKFRNCRHEREPGCAVIAAVEAGTLDARRAANYRKLQGEIAGAADQLATRKARDSHK